MRPGKITPYKGGRTAHFPRTRLTPDTRCKLDEILAARKISAADWVTEKIEQEYEQLPARDVPTG